MEPLPGYTVPTRGFAKRSLTLLNAPGSNFEAASPPLRRVDRRQAARLADAAGEAIELLHTYSLVHDDLPAMDDDDLRRGHPTLHRAFDEATAILAGDGLQAAAFQRLAEIED